MGAAPHRAGARAVNVLAAAVLALSAVLLSAPPASADLIRDKEWALDALHAQAAWATTKGEGVTVAVLDTGVDATHPDLAGQVLEGKDMVGFGAGPGDRPWARHGTAMAGIIAAKGHGFAGTEGVTGIAPEAKILPVRVILDDGDPQRKKARSERGSALPDGIRWAVDNGADVINLSLGDDSESAHPEPEEDAAIQYALRKGVVVVASAGNGAKEGDRTSYPAAYPGVISVTAVDKYGNRGDFSTRRWYASVAAPGVDVVIIDPDRRYYEGWGTSAAAAYVSGSVALILSEHPDLSPAQIKRLLESTARNTPSSGRSDAFGAGLIDPAAALDKAGDIEPAAAVPKAAAPPGRFFGPGPDPIVSESPTGDLAGILVPAAAVVGSVLLITAGTLYMRGQRERRPGVRA